MDGRLQERLNHIFFYLVIACFTALVLIYVSDSDFTTPVVRMLLFGLILGIMGASLYKIIRHGRLAEDKIIEQKHLLRAIIDNTPSLVYIKDIHGKYLMVNRTFEDVSGHPGASVLGKTDAELFSPDIAHEFASRDREALKKNAMVRSRHDMQINSDTFHFYAVRFPLFHNGDNAYGICAIATNISDVVTAQKLEQQTRIAETTIEAQERERHEIGKELHDNVSQLLATAKLMMDTAARQPESSEACLAKGREYLLEAIDEIRNLSHRMVPPAFDQQQFTEAVENLLRDYSNVSHLQVQLNTQQETNLLDDRIKLALYRILQEQMNNVIKHAAASAVLVVIHMDGALVRLKIEDNGRGFDPALPSKGIGLKNMSNRVSVLNGHMDIASMPGKGCTIQVSLPVHQPAHAS
ncbi:MAG TPA: PAS domain-containing protein [Flavisolibacter sp.]